MKYLISLCISLCLLSACRDLQEKDIRKNNIELVSPSDNYRSEILNTTFFWNKLDGASSYRLQITYNNFTDSMSLILDSVTTQVQFTKSLPYGKKFQWRVKPINYGYEGEFSAPRTLYIDSSANIAFQTVELTPTKLFIATKNQTFEWTALPQAKGGYTFMVDSANNMEVISKRLDATSYEYTFPREGQYVWSVVATDNINTSKKNAFAIKVDLTPPVVASLTDVSPTLAGRPTDSTVTLSWNSSDLPTFSGVKLHRIYIYSDSGSTIYSSAYNGKMVLGTTKSEEFVFPKQIRKLFWRIQAEDQSGQTTLSPNYGRIIISQ